MPTQVIKMTSSPHPYIAFEASKRIASGTLQNVALKVKHVLDTRPQASLLVFDQVTSELVDFDHRGTPEQMLKKLSLPPTGVPAHTPVAETTTAQAGPGRPRLGVVAREVTLLPRHWEWLNSQPGGASVSLRKLVEEAKRANHAKDEMRLSREASYRFMSAIAGHRAGFEEAARALFSGHAQNFRTLVSAWPADIRAHLHDLSALAFETSAFQDLQNV